MTRRRDQPVPMFDYAPAPESRSVVDIKPSYGLFIDGEFVDPVDGGTFKTINPATEEVLAEVAEAGPADVDAAVAAARRGVRAGLGPDARRGRGQVPVPHRPDHPGAGPGTRRAGVAGQRQADPRVAGRRHPAGRRRTSSTTPAGRTSSSTPGSAPTPGRSAWPARSSRGTSRCSCSPGRSPPRWRAATPWCSSRPRPRR